MAAAAPARLAADETPAAALERMARAQFGALSIAEVRMLDGAPERMLTWCGTSNDGNDDSNDPTKASKWGAERTIRAPVLTWLMSDPHASGYVHPSGIGLGGARISGVLDLSFLKIETPITLVDCAIDDGINLSDAETQSIALRKDSTGAVEAMRLRVHGDFAMVTGSYAVLDLYRSAIDGDLDLSGGHFVSEDDNAVSIIEANIAGDAIFHSDFISQGMVDMRLSTIGGSLSFNQAHFTGDGANGLNAERTRVAGAFYWTDVAINPRTVLDLEDAHVTTLWDSAQCWPAPGNLMINGLVYQSFGESPDDAQERLRWLELQPPGYYPQPYNQLAEVLRANGRDEAATDVMIAKRDAQLEFGQLTFAERVWQRLLKFTLGYGYRPLQALWLMIGFVVLGSLLFRLGYRVGVVTPTEADAFRQFIDIGRPPDHYPPFNCFVYSLENFLPLVDLSQGIHWRPNPTRMREREIKLAGININLGKIEGAALRVYLWLHILAGWILTPLFVAGLSGLVRS
jgi:hypothetical protein